MNAQIKCKFLFQCNSSDKIPRAAIEGECGEQRASVSSASDRRSVCRAVLLPKCCFRATAPRNKNFNNTSKYSATENRQRPNEVKRAKESANRRAFGTCAIRTRRAIQTNGHRLTESRRKCNRTQTPSSVRFSFAITTNAVFFACNLKLLTTLRPIILLLSSATAASSVVQTLCAQHRHIFAFSAHLQLVRSALPGTQCTDRRADAVSAAGGGRREWKVHFLGTTEANKLLSFIMSSTPPAVAAVVAAAPALAVLR